MYIIKTQDGDRSATRDQFLQHIHLKYHNQLVKAYALACADQKLARAAIIWKKMDACKDKYFTLA